MPVADLDKPLIPAFDVVIDGTPLPVELRVHTVSLMVDDSVDLPGMFALEVSGSDEQEDAALLVDDSIFNIGNVVEVKMGYDDVLETLIKGEITSLEPEFTFHRLPGLVVRGYDRRHRLQRGRKTRTFVQQKDSDIASQIASEAGLTSEVEDSQVTHDYVIQANQSDFDFLQQRARRIQFEVVVDDKKLLFRHVSNDVSESLTLSTQDQLLEFYPRLTSSRQVGEVNVRGWSLKDKKELIGKAKAGDEASKMEGDETGPELVASVFDQALGVESAIPVMTQAEVDQIAKSRFNELALNFIEGEGVCFGRTDLRAGRVVKIEGVGKRFSGQYYITAAIHRFDNKAGYRTNFTVRRSAS